MNTKKLKSIMALHGDTGGMLAKAINLSHTRFSAKLNDKNAEFTQSEMQTIKDRYNLTPEEVDDIFFNYTVS
ncbi:MAG TPA: XRE family transcriptional regulator [Epulopiscium sp.]|nr:XRE family transcriptional regulator [Candidatus Epulonipiscium sp.]